MAEFDDLELQRSDDADTVPPRAPLWTRLVLGLLIGVAIGAGYLVWRARSVPTPTEVRAQAEVPAAPAPAPVAEVEPSIDLPPLDGSDGTVRDRLRALSSHPQLTAWLASDQLVRRFVASLDNLAAGKSPVAHLKVLAPTGPFRVQHVGSRQTIDPASYRRYDLVADVVASMDSQACATAYRTLKPLFSEAYRELGQPGDVDGALTNTIRLVLATPVVDGPVEVRQSHVLYEFADPSLEQRSAAEKHLLRMGPRNLRLVQAKVREVARALGLNVETE